jgi:hypothetical protein
MILECKYQKKNKNITVDNGFVTITNIDEFPYSLRHTNKKDYEEFTEQISTCTCLIIDQYLPLKENVFNDIILFFNNLKISNVVIKTRIINDNHLKSLSQIQKLFINSANPEITEKGLKFLKRERT